MQPGAVVPGDVLHDCPPGPGPGRPGPGVDELALERGEERLGQRVVPAPAGPAGRQGDLAFFREGGAGAEVYTSAEFATELESLGIRKSVGRTGICYDIRSLSLSTAR